MKTIKRIIAVTLVLSTLFCIAGCKKNASFTHESARAAFKKNGAEETEDISKIYQAFSRNNNEGGIYYTSKDGTEAQQMFDSIVNRFKQYNEAEVETFTACVICHHKEKATTYFYMFTAKNEKDAKKHFDEISESAADSTYTDSGEKSGYKYTIGYESGDRCFIEGAYLKGNIVILVKAIGPESSMKDADDLIKDMKLLSGYDLAN